MPLVFNKNINKTTQLGLWHITENTDFFLSKLKLSSTEQQIFINFSNNQRQKQWLSYRLAIEEILNSDKHINVYYKKDKPLIKNYNISVSHSFEYSSVIISKNHQAGLDIEKISPRILKVKQRFLNDKEIIQNYENNYIDKLYVYWCAKEAIYKLYNDKSLIFKDNIIIEDFQFTPQGSCNAAILNKNINEKLVINFEKFNDYIIGYVIK
ncbi:MAG: 4'-phosphopantetheinyl transferase superfamily protein [Bacteroidales bacterium]|nr:4'-phosphopantetheinyl transferase superfamily protein [Bacteroidales bacterium]